jgi:UDP-N-acetylmuramoylalanine--D-glutamate ligase
MVEWLGRRTGVYGLGRTGRACIDFLLPRLVQPVVLVDETDAARLAALRAEAAGRYEVVGSSGIAAAIGGLDSLVLSPGVPFRNPNVSLAVERGIPVLSELELAARYCPGYIIAITGTNGKSTTTKLTGHILEAVGRTHVLGNIGDPLLGSLDSVQAGDFVALEVSSYQLEPAACGAAGGHFHPQVAIYTNLTPDHLERHGSMEEYARVKRSMARALEGRDFVVTNSRVPEFAPAVFENQRPLFLQYRGAHGRTGIARGAWLEGRSIHFDLGQEQGSIPLDCIKLPGEHNVENALAAALAALLAGATAETITERLSSFSGYEHRLELCRTLGNVRFYNDSKATNPEATITALKAMEPPLALILGGRDKLTELAELVGWIGQKVQHCVLIGEAAERFAAALRQAGYERFSFAGGLEEAVGACYDKVRAGGGSVLLSPACASFDQYKSFEQRGEHFKDIVARLPAAAGPGG